MKKLWILGDSWLCPWDSVLARGQKEYVMRYQPKLHVSNILKDKLECNEVVNLAKSGNCNYSILESLCKNINKITKDDIIVIGWSEITRWRNLSVHPNHWTPVGINFNLRAAGMVTGSNRRSVTKSFIEQECINRDSHLTADELNNWILLIEKLLPNQVIHWTPFQHMISKWRHLNIQTPNFKIETINDITNIRDYHPTEKSHIKISEWLLSVKSKKNYINGII